MLELRLRDVDLHLFNEGTRLWLYDCLGAHPGESDGQRGTQFAVRAPLAQLATVIMQAFVYDGRFSRYRNRFRGRVREGVADTCRSEDPVHRTVKR